MAISVPGDLGLGSSLQTPETDEQRRKRLLQQQQQKLVPGMAAPSDLLSGYGAAFS